MRLKPLLLLAALGAMPVAAEACSCMAYDTVEEKIAETEVAFFGVADEMIPATMSDDPGETYRTRFTVWRSYTGPDAPTLEVSHLLSSAACGLRFQTGKPQLVLAYRAGDGTLQTNSCTNITYTRDDKDLREALDARYPVKWWW
ncbi:hypothetical protein [Henriciella sp.]|uniref:hypothetical protein n=1 Tax=Henriciella sp. TaxID=1968823 RepID=UPI00261424ED|nr:hypothetical protein [Henriciella sp.]